MPAAQVTYVGHATVQIALDGVRLLTDPVLRRRMGHLRRRGRVDAAALRGVDTILISHAHYDHLDIPSLERLGRVTPIVVPRGLAPLVRRRSFAHVVELDVGEIRSLAEEAGEAEIADERARAIASGEADAGLVGAMGRLFDLVERPVERRVMLPLLRREVHFRLLLARHGGMLRRLSRRDSHASRIARSLSRIRKDYALPLRVAELADAAGMSPSSFHEHFKALTATTPLQYQKDLRLIEARRRLAAGGQSVSGIAYEVGYESPTQFSREYSRKFGTSPRSERLSA